MCSPCIAKQIKAHIHRLSYHVSLVFYPGDNYGFSVPVVSRNGVPVLDKGMAIACVTRLAVGVDKLTELALITWIEH